MHKPQLSLLVMHVCAALALCIHAVISPPSPPPPPSSVPSGLISYKQQQEAHSSHSLTDQGQFLSSKVTVFDLFAAAAVFSLWFIHLAALT